MTELTTLQLELREHARTIARERIAPHAAEVDRSEQYPWDNVAVLTESGYMGMTIPTEYGGLGLSYLDAVVVVERGEEPTLALWSLRESGTLDAVLSHYGLSPEAAGAEGGAR